MSKPIEPQKPRKPTHPHPNLPPKPKYYGCKLYDGKTLQQLIEAVGDIDPSLVKVSMSYGHDNDPEINLFWENTVPRPNPRYEQQIENFRRHLVDYEEDLILYAKQMLNYKKCLKESLENELRSLEQS